jgi:decaprenylphospho-beta-D-erythro-pentofuranosid-2-ulose 2-reductase
MARSIVIFGATSTIARQIALTIVAQGDRVCLAARNAIELTRVAADVELRCSPAVMACTAFDTGKPDTHRRLHDEIVALIGDIDVAVFCTGELGDQDVARHEPELINRIIHSNFSGVATMLAPVVDRMEFRGRGAIAVLSSVAGDRARQSNYVYGSSKAGMDAYLAGLRHRLFRSGITVTTIKLGFTDTRMVYGKQGMFLVATPAKAARDIVAQIERGNGVAYVPWFWRWIMLVIRSVPGCIFNRTKL